MKPWLKPEQVRGRIPKGREMPARFDAFLRTEPPFAIEWNDLDQYSLKRSALKEVVPFLRLPDGGLVAFWFHTARPAVVQIGGHGELKVVARDFDDFLLAIGARSSGLPDFDEAVQAFRVPGMEGPPNSDELPALQEKFDDWFKNHTSLQEPLTTPGAESLRQRVYQIAEEMIRDGLSKVYTLASPWWSVDFQIARNGPALSITYLNYGKWCPVPQQYKLIDEIQALLKLVKHKKRDRYELSVCRPGILSIDRDRELVLVPPETVANTTRTQAP